MPTILTRQFGPVEIDEGNVFEFPVGIPGFENERQFVCIEKPALRPLIFLQSTLNSDLCFITIPARSVEPGYELDLPPDELRVLGVEGPGESQASDLACLAIVCLAESGEATANLLGPVVLSRETRKGVQAVRDDRRYSALTPLQNRANAPTQQQPTVLASGSAEV
jgi:flagellar assembly factor FliW